MEVPRISPAISPIRLLVADDHPLVRAGVLALLAGHVNCQVVGEAGDGEQAARLWRERQPDLGLIDLRMPRCDGFEAIRSIRTSAPQARLIAMTTLSGDEDVFNALNAGASGYLLKDCSATELHACIDTVLRGQRYLHPMAAGRLAERITHEPLTPRERDVLDALAEGHSNKLIARQLGIGEGTVKFHVKALLDKLGACSRTQVVHLALQRGLIHATG